VKILVLEDNNNKAAQVSDLLSSIKGVRREDITPCADISSAKRELAEKNFDLLILDVQIPNRFDEDPKRLGGIELLREIKYRDKYHLPAHVIGLTAYEDFPEAREFFSDNGWALLKFSESDIQWQAILRNYSTYIFEHQNRTVSQNPAENGFDYDVVIICALPEVEFESIARLPFDFKLSARAAGMQFLDGIFETRKKKHKVAATFAPHMGLTACAVLTLNMIHQLKPRYIVMSGIAGGVSGKVNIGDILIPDQSWDYGSGKLVVESGRQKFTPDPHPINLDPALKSTFQTLSLNNEITDRIKNEWPGEKPSTSLKLHVGPLASGASVIADPSVIEGILDYNRKLLGLDMENYAFFHAAAHAPHPRPVAFSAKSVSDMANEKKNSDYQRYAAYTSAQLLYYFISNHLLD
jgi:nucleoside phosphorylase/CheY-like chemotaxis protein